MKADKGHASTSYNASVSQTNFLNRAVRRLFTAQYAGVAMPPIHRANGHEVLLFLMALW